jgi:hypothetical protein
MKLLPRFTPMQKVAAEYGLMIHYEASWDAYILERGSRRVLMVSSLLLNHFKGDPLQMLRFHIECLL